MNTDLLKPSPSTGLSIECEQALHNRGERLVRNIGLIHRRRIDRLLPRDVAGGETRSARAVDIPIMRGDERQFLGFHPRDFGCVKINRRRWLPMLLHRWK